MYSVFCLSHLVLLISVNMCVANLVTDNKAVKVDWVGVRAARYEENMRYVITLLNVAITILLVINEQILKCTNFCLSAAKILI